MPVIDVFDSGSHRYLGSIEREIHFNGYNTYYVVYKHGHCKVHYDKPTPYIYID